MRYTVTINNTNYEVEVGNGQAGIISTKEAGVQTAAPTLAPTPAVPAVPVKAAPAAVNAGNGQVIKAPMPGTILDVKVSAGTKVKKGTVLLILEAMKMENEIVASAEGTVAQVQVSRGSTVSAGDLLAVIQ